ncbi:emopamil binding protein [Colletotrichum musicola]|uniref:Emopamil binding protein n=1 Tax=Colletotrichum musicola TaxID=2175873 RepID=A0A8H6NZT4_9PEZI|nr:emopamil binding protein [Colletotrichum musicola]
MGSPLASDAARVLHPYHPLNAPLDHFAANETPVETLLLFFGGILSCVVIAAIAAARIGAKRAHVVLTVVDHLSVAWFASCALTLTGVTGYFIFNHARLASLQTLFAQLWKEYSLSDSRYLTSDPFMLSVESFTVFVWGPLCWAIVASIALRSKLRRPLSIVMCVGHLYGVALYYSTSLAEHYFNGVSHSRPEFLYFWVYYVGLNGPWVVIPACMSPFPSNPKGRDNADSKELGKCCCIRTCFASVRSQKASKS